MRKRFQVLILFILLKAAAAGQPSGIYVLDNSLGTYRDANIRADDFVDGFVWRTGWGEIETAQGVYDFSGIDHIVKKLDSIGKKLTVLFGAYSLEPAYIAQHAGVVTYTFIDPVSNLATPRAVPYDSYLLERFRIFLDTLSKHPVWNMSSGSMVTLSQHPVLANIATNIPGLGAIRNVNGVNVSVSSTFPGYSRSAFTDSIVSCIKIQVENFATKNVFIPFYRNITDTIGSPPLEIVIRNRLLTTFNGVVYPKISFWQENLAGFTDTATRVFTGLPLTSFATPLYQLGDSAYTMFQMLQGWTTPFANPEKTANSTPFDAMCYAWHTYNAAYYEIYVSDIDNPLYRPSFETWNPLASCSMVVPVRFISVAADRDNTSVNISWQVAATDEPMEYIVERSVDGRNVSSVGSITTPQVSFSQTTFNLEDATAPGTSLLYRIKAIGTNHEVIYSKWVAVGPPDSKSYYTILAKPTSPGTIAIRFNNRPPGIYQFSVVNNIGQYCCRATVIHAGGSSEKLITVPLQLPHGCYWLLLAAPGSINPVVLSWYQ